MTKRIFLLFGLLISAGVALAAPPDTNPLVDGDPEAGKQVAAPCAACHGPKGNMESAQFPKLAGQGAPYILEQLKLFKSGERQNAIMAGQVAGLDDQAMSDVAAYFAAQKTRPAAADKAIAPAGAKLYHGGDPDKNIPACSGCHGPSGLGNAAAKFPRLSGQNAPYVVAQLTAYRDGKRAGYRNAKIMADVANRLSDKQIKALASYVAGLAPSREGAGNDKGALMQNVAGPSESGAQQGGAEESGQSNDAAEGESGGSAGSADSGSENPAQGATGAEKSQQEASGSAQEANAGEADKTSTDAATDDAEAASDSSADQDDSDGTSGNTESVPESAESNSQQ